MNGFKFIRVQIHMKIGDFMGSISDTDDSEKIESSGNLAGSDHQVEPNLASRSSQVQNRVDFFDHGFCTPYFHFFD